MNFFHKMSHFKVLKDELMYENYMKILIIILCFFTTLVFAKSTTYSCYTNEGKFASIKVQSGFLTPDRIKFQSDDFQLTFKNKFITEENPLLYYQDGEVFAEGVYKKYKLTISRGLTNFINTLYVESKIFDGLSGSVYFSNYITTFNPLSLFSGQGYARNFQILEFHCR